MHAKHEEDPSSHLEYDPDFLLEVEATSRPDMNWVYGISMAKGLQPKIWDRVIVSRK
jgi:hypothetical protein